MLSALGVPAAEEELFRALLRHPNATLGQLARESGRPESDCEQLLNGLEGAGLVNPVAGQPQRYVAVAPDVAFRSLISARQAALHRAEAEIVTLTREYRASLGATAITGVVEVLSGQVNTRQRARALHEQAATEVLSMLGPLPTGHALSPVPEPAATARPTTSAPASRPGLRRRTVVEAAALERGQLRPQLSGVDGGREPDAGELRIATAIPATMIVYDRATALVLLASADEFGDSGAVLVRPSALLDALLELFERVWAAAAPTERVPAKDTMLSTIELQVLTLLVSGLTDRAIAHQLGISERSVQRYVRVLMDLAAARSRLQLGWYASGHGWLG